LDIRNWFTRSELKNGSKICKCLHCRLALVSFFSDVQSGVQKQEGWPPDSLFNAWQNSGMHGYQVSIKNAFTNQYVMEKR
jgi:hypothetical protein